jgi:hypothetical protein
MASFAPSVSIQTSEDTESTYKNKINSKGFCVNHPDIRVRIKKALQDDIITPCPKCAASDEQDLENKKKNEKQKRAIERAKAKKEYGEDIRLSDDIPTFNPITLAGAAPPMQQPQLQQPGVVTAVIYSNNSAEKHDPLKDEFSSTWVDCCEDPSVCCIVGIPCCFPITTVCYASKIGIDDTHGLCPLLFSIMSTVCCPCSLVLCHKKMIPCFATSLLQRAMDKHHVKNAPGPCGDVGFYDFWCQVLFCAQCTLCMLCREAKKFPVTTKK